MKEKKEVTNLNVNQIIKRKSPKDREMIEKMYSYLKDGYRAKEILAMFLVDYPDLEEEDFYHLLNFAHKYAEIAIQKDRDYTFQLHLDRYEKTYLRAMDMNGPHGPLERNKHWPQMVAKYKTALVALKQKEDLMGLHDKNFVIEFNDQNITIHERETTGGRFIEGLDISKLNLEEKVELLRLVQECRTVPIEGVQRVIIKQTKIEISNGQRIENQIVKTKDIQKTLDVEFEEMSSDVVSQFKEIEQEKKIEGEDEIIGPKIIDSTNGKSGKTINDVTENINKNLLDQFKKALKDKRNK